MHVPSHVYRNFCFGHLESHVIHQRPSVRLDLFGPHSSKSGGLYLLHRDLQLRLEFSSWRPRSTASYTCTRRSERNSVSIQGSIIASAAAKGSVDADDEPKWPSSSRRAG